MFMARLSADVLSAGYFSLRRAVVRIEISDADSGGESKCGMNNGEVKRLQAKCSVVSRSGYGADAPSPSTWLSRLWTVAGMPVAPLCSSAKKPATRTSVSVILRRSRAVKRSSGLPNHKVRNQQLSHIHFEHQDLRKS